MRSIALFALFAAALPAICTAEQPVPITVSIVTPTPVTKSGAEVRIGVTVANTSDHAVKLYKALGPDGQAEEANHVDAYDADGKALSRIDGRAVQVHGETHHLPKQWIGRTTVFVEPGKTADDFLILSNLFDLSKPGKYTVTVRQEKRADDSDPDVKLIYATSNKVAITVLPADGPPTARQ
jgi:hypothetical protein